jgi:hypothetical protein
VTPGHSWTIAGSAEHAAYAIDGEPAVPVQRYAIDVDLIQGAAVEIHGTGWVGAKSGCHTRIVDLLAWVADDNGIGGYEVTGGGAERLTYASAPRLRQPHRVESRNLRGGAVHEIARFDIPPYYDNTQGGELMWSLAYAARVPRSIGLRFIVQIDGKGTIAAQVLTPQYLSGEVGNLNGRADIGIGRRDPKRGHGVRLLVEIPNGVEIAALTGSLALVIGQDTGIVG